MLIHFDSKYLREMRSWLVSTISCPFSINPNTITVLERTSCHIHFWSFSSLVASGGFIAEECLCWRANDWRKRLLINPFHLSQFPTQSKPFYLKGMHSDWSFSHLRVSVSVCGARTKGGRATGPFFSDAPLRWCVCVWIFLLLPLSSVWPLN